MKPFRNGLVSVIMPAFNRGLSIRRSIESCLEQTYPYIEVILIDDGSTDDTREIVSAISKHWNNEDKYVQYYYQDNQGACAARNNGMNQATGEFIQFLDSDDWIDKEKISAQISDLNKSKADVSFCDFAWIDESGNVIESIRNNLDLHKIWSNFNSVFISTPIIRRESISERVRWNVNLHRQQDIDFMARYFSTVDHWVHSPGFYSKYVQHSGAQISDGYINGVQWKEQIRSYRKFIQNNMNLIPTSNRKLVYYYVVRLHYERYKEFLKRIILRILQVDLEASRKKYES